MRTLILLALSISACAQAEIFPGADEATPARAQYFSWINNTNEGASEAHTLTNLEFFNWLNKEYGMQLDIYAFDAGAIDGKRWYGSTSSEKFKAQFPNGFEHIYRQSRNMGIRLGIWGGPDGFGDTPAEAARRIAMMAELCEKYHFALFKFDSVAGNLRNHKQDEFVDMMTQCRQHAPDLILLNHRLNLGSKALPHATTFLWEGLETYIDVHMVNKSPALHHRAGALARGLPPKLSRLTEDHGVCLSSALDYWDDELVLQAFNRSLILSPQIYCNPWLLRDDEYPKLARLFNLARQYKDILVHGLVLPEDQYGPSAVSRGDESTRLITLRNLSWEAKNYTLSLNKELGIKQSTLPIEVRRYHPSETIYGTFAYGDEVNVTVAPFRSLLLRVTYKPDFGLTGIDYEVIRESKNISTGLSRSSGTSELLLLGQPGESYSVGLSNTHEIKSIELDGQSIKISDQVSEQPLAVHFGGPKHEIDQHLRLGNMSKIKLPSDAETLYEATVFSADNNALEVRSLFRSGATIHNAVQNARNSFFNQSLFVERAIWDRNLFDGDFNTAFAVMNRWSYWWNNHPDPTVNDGAFRLDLGDIEKVDSIVLHTRDEFTLQPAKTGEGIVAEVSSDLRSWSEVRFIAGKKMEIVMPKPAKPLRYLRIKSDSPHWISEVQAYQNDKPLSRTNWRASNLFGGFDRMQFSHAWQLSTRLKEIAADSYLAVAVAGETGNEGVYAAIRVEGEAFGAPDRAPSYPANTWELQVKPVMGNYTYFIPLKPEWQNKAIDVVLLATDLATEISPEIWLTRKPKPLASKQLKIGYQ